MTDTILTILLVCPWLWGIPAVLFAIGVRRLAGPEPKARAARRMSKNL